MSIVRGTFSTNSQNGFKTADIDLTAKTERVCRYLLIMHVDFERKLC